MVDKQRFGVRIPSWAGVLALISCASALGACGAPDPSQPLVDSAAVEPAAAELSQAVTAPTIATWHDDSAAPLHVEVRACTTTTPASSQVIDCTVDWNYALVGGGAQVSVTTAGAMLVGTQGGPSAGSWRASSHDEFVVSPHNLTSYAVGIRLDGVNSKVLRDTIVQYFSLSIDSPSLQSGLSHRIAGGFSDFSGLPRFLKETTPGSGADLWGGVVSPHLFTPPPHASVVMWESWLPSVIIEGFGMLDIVTRTGANSPVVSTGRATAVANVAANYAVLGYGARANVTSGPGRLLTALGPNGSNLRQVMAQSIDHSQASAGSTTPFWVEGAKVPGTHGLCSEGNALFTGVDSCVDRLCASDSYCCLTKWDDLCVSEVTSICGQTCANDTCSVPSFSPSFWTGTPQTTNSDYNYALNRRTDTNAQPGRYSGQNCAPGQCGSAAATLAFYSVNDGLIPTTLAGTCPDFRDKVALVASASRSQWYRLDWSGTWSYKPANLAPSNRDASGALITDLTKINLGTGTSVVGYFCACSSATEGAGHSAIN